MENLSRREFVDRFEASSRTLWCIAAAVLGSRDEAEDVVQEAVSIALSKLDDFDPQTNFTAWMGQIVRNVARNTGRRKARHRLNGSVDPDDQTLVQRGSRTREQHAINQRGELLADQHHFDDRVLSALNALDETPRACLLLRAIEDMPYSDIALALDIPRGTAMSHVHRARQAMKQRIPERTSSNTVGQDDDE